MNLMNRRTEARETDIGDNRISHSGSGQCRHAVILR